MACLAAVTRAYGTHEARVVGKLKPKELPQFDASNTTLGNVTTATAGTCHALAFSKYAHRDFTEFAGHFYRRFDPAA